MPSLANYRLKISGLLGGKRNDNKAAETAFDEIFQTRPSGNGGQGWPDGFQLDRFERYVLCQWDPRVEDYRGDRTLFEFNTEFHITKSGTLSNNWGTMQGEVDWFYNSDKERWYRDLNDLMEGFNNNGAWAQDIITPLSFCGWQWYCGNGGP